MLWEALRWAPKIFTLSSPGSRFEWTRGPSISIMATVHKRPRDEHGEVVDLRSGAARSGMGRDLVGKVLVSFGFGNGNLLATGTKGMDEWPNFSTVCTDRISLVLAVEIGRARKVDFSDWGVDETGVRPTINRDHGSKEAERRAWLGSQTSTPSIAPPHCRRERPQRGRTVRTVGLAVQVPCYSSQKRVTG